MLTTMNKVKIPVGRLKQIIQEEVTRFYNLEEDEDIELLDSDEDDMLANPEDELDEATVTGSTEQDKQAAIANVTNALKSGTPDRAVAAAASAGVPVPNVRAVR